MIFIFIAAAVSTDVSSLEMDLERHATKIKQLSLELERSMVEPDYFSPARIDFLTEKIQAELIRMEKKTSKF